MRVTCSVNRLWVCLFPCWGWRGGEGSSLLLSRCHRPLGAWPRLAPPVIQDLSFKLCQSSTSFPGLSHTQEHLCYESPPVMLSGLGFSSPMLVPARTICFQGSCKVQFCCELPCLQLPQEEVCLVLQGRVQELKVQNQIRFKTLHCHLPPI